MEVSGPLVLPRPSASPARLQVELFKDRIRERPRPLADATRQHEVEDDDICGEARLRHLPQHPDGSNEVALQAVPVDQRRVCDVVRLATILMKRVQGLTQVKGRTCYE